MLKTCPTSENSLIFLMLTKYPLFNRLGMGIPSSIHYESFANNVVENQEFIDLRRVKNICLN